MWPSGACAAKGSGGSDLVPSEVEDDGCIGAWVPDVPGFSKGCLERPRPQPRELATQTGPDRRVAARWERVLVVVLDFPGMVGDDITDIGSF